MTAAWLTIGTIAVALAWIEIRRALQPGSALRQILETIIEE